MRKLVLTCAAVAGVLSVTIIALSTLTFAVYNTWFAEHHHVTCQQTNR